MSVMQAEPRPGGTDRALPDRRALSILVVGQLLAGVLAGLIWLAWSPSSVSYLLDAGNGTGIVVPAESESQIAGDGRYVLLTAVAGLVFGLLVWRLRASRGRLVLAILAVSSLLASLIALGTGELLSGRHRPGRLNTAFHPQLVLHATAAVFVQALVAVLLYTVLVGLASDQSLGRDEPGPAPSHAGTAPAGTGRAETGHPGSGQAGTAPAGTGQAETGHPGSGHPGTAHHETAPDGQVAHRPEETAQP
ncbi:MAG TPA: hypothetical protein VMB79_15025 [Jatrophihabitans sp.]|nr:hypothetical protein [Jatrophihabitans sp.]